MQAKLLQYTAVDRELSDSLMQQMWHVPWKNDTQLAKIPPFAEIGKIYYAVGQ